MMHFLKRTNDYLGTEHFTGTLGPDHARITVLVFLPANYIKDRKPVSHWVTHTGEP